MNEPPLLTADEVGELLGVTGSTVRRRTRAGLIPAQRVGKAGQYLYLPEDVNAYGRIMHGITS